MHAVERLYPLYSIDAKILKVGVHEIRFTRPVLREFGFWDYHRVASMCMARSGTQGPLVAANNFGFATQRFRTRQIALAPDRLNHLRRLG